VALIASQPQEPFPANVQAALAEGKLWRAKEMLQGRIGTSQFDPILYEQYGLVLHAMGDTVEAGKYLFLCGQRKPEYEEAIALYMSRYGRYNWQSLVATFPARARKLQNQLLPQTVQAELLRLQAPTARGHETLLEPIVVKLRWYDNLGCALSAFCFLVFCTLIVGGVIYFVQKISAWLS
jgi:hypothetical protein